MNSLNIEKIPSAEPSPAVDLNSIESFQGNSILIDVPHERLYNIYTRITESSRSFKGGICSSLDRLFPENYDASRIFKHAKQ
jgi:hypothetical protein